MNIKRSDLDNGWSRHPSSILMKDHITEVSSDVAKTIQMKGGIQNMKCETFMPTYSAPTVQNEEEEEQSDKYFDKLSALYD